MVFLNQLSNGSGDQTICQWKNDQTCQICICITQKALLETGSLPSAKCFAECQKSGTRQRPSLPSVALGKEFFAECRTLGKKGHSAKDFFAECQTLGKISTLGIGCPRKRRPVTAFFAERLLLGTRQRFDFLKNFFAECPRSDTRQRFKFF